MTEFHWDEDVTEFHWMKAVTVAVWTRIVGAYHQIYSSSEFYRG